MWCVIAAAVQMWLRAFAHWLLSFLSCLTLQARPNSIAVFVPSEITTYCFYPGLQRDFMVSGPRKARPTVLHVLGGRACRRRAWLVSNCCN
jgi:hypothetical protein